MLPIRGLDPTVFGARNSSPAYQPQQVAPHRAPTRKPTPPPPSFDAQLAAQAMELYAHLLAEADVHEFYLAGSLFDALTREPKAAIAVPMDA